MNYETTKQYSLYHGNCLELIADIDSNSIDMIFADPPYRLSNDGITCSAGKMVSVNKGEWDKSQGIEADFLFHEKWLQECKRILKEDGTIWVSGTYHSIYACGYAMQKLGYHMLNDICWFKPNASPNLSCRMFTASHETILWARKSKKVAHRYNYHDMKHGDYLEDKFKTPDKQMRSVWSISTTPSSEKTFGKHPTQKPLKLMQRIILSSTKEGDIVLDPFCGSGSTGVASISHGRNFIGIEKESEYIELASKRLSNITNNILTETA